MTYGLLFLIIALGAVLQSSIGFGFGVFCMAFLPYLFPYGTSVAFSLLMSMANSLILLVRYRRSVRWRVLLPFLLPNLLVGAWITFRSAAMPGRSLRIALGALLVVLSLYFLCFADRARITANPYTGAGMGVATGVINGFFGIGGPTTTLYLLPATGDKLAYLATTQCSFVLTSVCNVAIRVYEGMVTSSHIPALLVGWCAVACGTAIGMRLFTHIDLARLKRFVYLFIGCNGIIVIWQNW